MTNSARPSDQSFQADAINNGYINTFQDGVLIESKRRTPAANENVKAAGSKVQDNAAGARKIGTVTHVGTISHGAFVNFGTMTYIGNTRIGNDITFK